VKSLARRVGRTGLAAVGGAVLVLTAVAFMRVPLLPDIGADLGLSAAQLGLVTTIFAVGRLLTDLPAGRLADRVAPPAALLVAACGSAVACALLATAHGLTQLAAALALVGAASALANTIGMTAFSAGAGPDRRGTAMASFATALMLGQMVGPALGGGLAAFGSWRVAPAAGVALAAATAVACLRSATIARGDRAAPAAGASRAAGAGDDPSRRVAAVLALAEPDLAALRRGGRATAAAAEPLALASVNFAVFFALGALPQTLIPVIGSDELGLSTAVLGAAAALAGLARLGGAVATGYVSDRVSRRAALIPSLALMSASVAVLALPVVTASWLAALAVMSLASSGVSVAATLIADRSPAGVLGRRFGTFRVFGDLGLLAGPASAAFVYQHSGRPPAVLLVAGVLLASALACALLVTEPLLAGRRPRGGEAPAPPL
jgi:MFS family permease